MVKRLIRLRHSLFIAKDYGLTEPVDYFLNLATHEQTRTGLITRNNKKSKTLASKLEKSLSRQTSLQDDFESILKVYMPVHSRIDERHYVNLFQNPEELNVERSFNKLLKKKPEDRYISFTYPVPPKNGHELIPEVHGGILESMDVANGMFLVSESHGSFLNKSRSFKLYKIAKVAGLARTSDGRERPRWARYRFEPESDGALISSMLLARHEEPVLTDRLRRSEFAEIESWVAPNVFVPLSHMISVDQDKAYAAFLRASETNMKKSL